MSDSLFIEVMTGLIRNANVPGTDTSYAADARAELLASHQVSQEDLELKASALSKNPEHASTVWLSIRLKLGPQSSAAIADSIDIRERAERGGKGEGSAN